MTQSSRNSNLSSPNSSGVGKVATNKKPSQPRRLVGLDSLRAFGLIAVILYHFCPSLLGGGFLGVEIFFVLSGFLITNKIVRQPTYRFKGEFKKRLKRILPPTMTMVVIVAIVGALIDPDLIVHLPSRALGALTGTSNWIEIGRGTTYAGALYPNIFNHLWTTSVEMQFYLLWPLLVLGARHLLRTTRISWLLEITRGSLARVAAALSIVLAVLSQVETSILFPLSDNPTRVYFGTDTHFSSLMFGAFLACLITPTPAVLPTFTGLSHAQKTKALTRIAKFDRVQTIVLGALALLMLTLMFASRWDSQPTYEGITFVFGICVSLVVFFLSRIHSLRMPRWLERFGQRSFSIYLWHWPIYIIAMHITSNHLSRNIFEAPNSETAVLQVLVFAGIFLLSFVMAELSFRFVEPLYTRDRFVIKFTQFNAAVIALVSIAFIYALTMAPAQTQLELQLDQAQAEIDSFAKSQSQNDEDLGLSQSPGAAQEAEGEVVELTPTPQQVSRDNLRLPDPTERTVDRRPGVLPQQTFSFIGDSVGLGAGPWIADRLRGVQFDAVVSRHMFQAVDVINQQKSDSRLGHFVIIELAMNSQMQQSDLDAIYDAAGSGHWILFVTQFGSPVAGNNNDILRDQVATHKNVGVIDWEEFAPAHTEAFWADGMHLRDGADYADFITRAVEAITYDCYTQRSFTPSELKKLQLNMKPSAL